jgi:PAP2 superfamily
VKVPFPYFDAVCVLLIFLFSAFLFSASNPSPFSLDVASGSVFLAVAAIVMPSARRELCIFGLLLPLSLFVIHLEERLVVQITSRTIDASLLRMEHGASVTIYDWVSAHPIWHRVLTVIYGYLPLATALVLIVTGRRSECMAAVVLAGLFAPIFYVLFPAVGPAWVNVADAPRNCLPSLHMAWALILLVYTPARARILAILFAGLTGFATLGLGEHYIIDLVAAVPYTYAVCFVAKKAAHARVHTLIPRLLFKPASRDMQ